MKSVIPSPFLSAAIMRRTAVCDHYILISARTWAGGGSISLKVIMLTSAPAPVLTYVALTPPTARCWAYTTPWTQRRPPHPAVSLRTWSPSPSSTTWVAPRKSSSSPTWLSSPASAAKRFWGPSERHGMWRLPALLRSGYEVLKGGGRRGTVCPPFLLLQPCPSSLTKKIKTPPTRCGPPLRSQSLAAFTQKTRQTTLH